MERRIKKSFNKRFFKVCISEAAKSALNNVGFDIEEYLSDTVNLMNQDCNPVYNADSVDDLLIDGVKVSWIRDGDNREITILTNEETGFFLDSFSNGCIC